MPYVLESLMGDTSFSLEINGYQFEDEFQNEHRMNKLMITFTAKNFDGSWSATKPVLQTWEVEEIIRWIRSGFTLEPLIMFVDPSLQLYAETISENEVHLQVIVSEELLPAWHIQSPIILDLIVSPDSLRRFAIELEMELAAYPYRSSDVYG